MLSVFIVFIYIFITLLPSKRWPIKDYTILHIITFPRYIFKVLRAITSLGPSFATVLNASHDSGIVSIHPHAHNVLSKASYTPHMWLYTPASSSFAI